MKNIIAFVGCFLLLATCQSKKVRVDFEQKECKSLVLKNATYTLEEKTCDGADPIPLTSNVLKIKVEHNNKKSCLENFEIKATFWDMYGNQMMGIIADSNYKERYKYTDPEVTLTDGYIEIRFKYFGLTEQEAKELRTIKIVLTLANELQSKTNLFTLTVPLSCISQSNGGNYKVVRDIKVNQSTVELRFRDYASIDGDIVTVYLNGNVVVSRMTLRDDFQYFTVTVNPGQNVLAVFAENEGSDSPNTCEIWVNNTTQQLTPDFLTGQAVNINF